MKKFILLLALAYSPLAVSGYAVGQITDVALLSNGNYLIVKTVDKDNDAACSTWNHNFGIEYSESNPISKGFLSILLSAQASKQTIKISGTGECHLGQSGFEIIDFINIGPEYN